MREADSIAPSHGHLGGHTVQLSTLTPVKGVGLETLGSSGVGGGREWRIYMHTLLQGIAD